MKKVKLMLGDNIESLKKLPDNSIDSVVTDPPYGLSFMNKKWDYDVPSVEFWKEIFRVLKPGGHILSFGGTRTYHRMVVNIEDAGFEIRDQIQWLYGSGFPKSLNVGKAVDKLEGNERKVVGENPNSRPNTHLGNKKDDITYSPIGYKVAPYPPVTKGQTEWEGWGSALKPANEPICLARKPLSEKSIAENVLKWRTGGLNIDGCRIVTDDNLIRIGDKLGDRLANFNEQSGKGQCNIKTGSIEGRFPSNLILDETAAEMLDEQSGMSKSNKGVRILDGKENKVGPTGWKEVNRTSGEIAGFNDKGGASRFFYVAKVSKSERNMGLDGFEDKIRYALYEPNTIKNWSSASNDLQKLGPAKNNHPTVKPINLMSYLCKLITPSNGIVLDPFMGSGSTGIAALLNGFRFVGMEMDNDYFKIAEARINSYEDYKKFLKK